MATRRRLREKKDVDYSDQLFITSPKKSTKKRGREEEKENQVNNTKATKSMPETKKRRQTKDADVNSSNTSIDSVASEGAKSSGSTKKKRKPFADKTNATKKSAVSKEDVNSSIGEDDGEAFELSKAKSICSSVKKRLSKPMFGSDLESDSEFEFSGTPGPKPVPVPYKEEYENLLRKYKELKELRTTKAEELYEQHQVNAGHREKVLQGFVDNAKKEIEKLTTLLSNAREKAQEMETNQEKAEADLVQLTKIVAFYECMSRVHVVPQDNTRFMCSCSSTNGREITFLMAMGEGSFEYEPVKVGDESGQWVVPPYLEKTIYFADREGPKWFAKLLASLYH